MRNEPYDRDCQRRHKKQKHDLSLPPLFAQSAGPSARLATVEQLRTFHRNRHVKSLFEIALGRGPVAFMRGRFLPRRGLFFFDDAFERFELLA